MSAFAEALGGLAGDYGKAGVINRQDQLANSEMALRASHEQLYQALAKRSLAQQDFLLQQEKIKAGMPLFIGQPYKAGGQRYQDIWDIHAGQPGRLQLGPEESPVDAFVRDYQSKNNGQAPPQDVMNAALFSAYGVTPPKPAPQTDYEIRQDSKGQFIRIPKQPGLPNSPTGIIGKLADLNPSAPAASTGGPLPNAIDERYANALANKEMSLDQLSKVYTGRALEGRRLTVVDRAKSLGFSPNEQSSPAAQGVVMKTMPVLQQADRMLQDIENLKLDKNNTPGYLAAARAKYALGIASPEGTLGNDIAGLSLGSVVEAASALQGSSRSIQALQKALVHTPNPWVDSPQLLHQKLTEIRARLQDIVNDAQKFGTKSGLPNAGKSAPKVVIGPDGSITVQ